MTPDQSADLGLLMWAALFWFGFWIRRCMTRKTKAVSRNTAAKWEQIAPMDECFDDLED